MNRRSFITKTLTALSAIPLASQIANALEPRPVGVHYPAGGYFAGDPAHWPKMQAFQICITRNGVPENLSYIVDSERGVISFHEAQ